MADHASLLEGAWKGDVGAFETLLEPLIEPACKLAYAILQDWQEAEDATQEAALKAWRGLGRLRPDTTSLRPWFMTVVANEARSRRRVRWWSVLRFPELPTGAGGMAAADPESQVVLHADLDRAMQRLTETDRLLLVMHFYLDMPFEEAGKVLGFSAEAARSRAYRATRSLRPEMRRRESV